MRGDSEVIEFLNAHLTAELTIINQYFLNSRMLDNWGLPGLAKVFRDISIEEMEDAEKLIDRILFLGGHPNLQRLETVQVGEDPKEMMELALGCEDSAIERLKNGVELCTSKGDHASRDLAADMLREEEEHADYFESQLDVLARIGLENYLANFAGSSG